MPQETLGYVKLEWTCPKCGTRNPGTEKSCVSCGAPQPQEVQFEQAPGQQISQDETLKKMAEAGPDINCPYCGTRNPGNAKVCLQCGGDLTTGVRREAGKVVGAYQPKPVQQIACPNCGSMNPETAVKCANCGAPLGKRPEAAPAAAPPAAPRPAPRAWIWIAVGVVAFLCLLGVGGFLTSRLMTRSNTIATVSSVQWKTAVNVEALGPVKHEGWQDQIPSGAQIGACQQQVRSVQSNPPAGGQSNKVCGTAYTVDTGSGVGKVVQDCQYQVLAPYCQYTVNEWRVVAEVTEVGNNLAPAFPDPQLQQGQRLGSQTSSLVVTFETLKGTYEYRVNSVDQFRQFPVGSRWTLVLNGFNQVVGVEPAQ